MNKLYRLIVAYNPFEDKITVFKKVNFMSDTYDREASETFYKVLALANHTTDIVLGYSVGRNFYQLSPTHYKTYIKEDSTSVEKNLNKSKLLCAIDKYVAEKNIPYDW